MRINFIQFGSPHDKPGGYRWLVCGGLTLENLNDILKNLQNVTWGNSDAYQGGIMIFSKKNIGIVFRRIKSRNRDASNRVATLTNGFAFNLQDAAVDGINGIWTLPHLNDPNIDYEEKIIEFTPSVQQYPDNSFQMLSEALLHKKEAFYVIKEENSVYKLFKVFEHDLSTIPTTKQNNSNNKTSILHSVEKAKKKQPKINVDILKIVSKKQYSLKNLFYSFIFGCICGLFLAAFYIFDCQENIGDFINVKNGENMNIKENSDQGGNEENTDFEDDELFNLLYPESLCPLCNDEVKD